MARYSQIAISCERSSRLSEKAAGYTAGTGNKLEKFLSNRIESISKEEFTYLEICVTNTKEREGSSHCQSD